MKMSWVVAHAIFCVELEKGRQSTYPVWEDMFLIRAKSPKHAHSQAERVARRHASILASMTLDGKRARMVFKGIRKIVGFINHPLETELAHGEEISHLKLELKSKRDVLKLAQGKPVTVLYER